MTAQITSSVWSAELLKMRKRWLPYILLVVLLLLVGVHIWLGGYVGWRYSEDFETRTDSLRSFVLPWMLPGLLETMQFWGSILVGIVAASAVATEHGWGTVRQALVRGQTRSSYLTTKLLGIATIGLAGFAIALLAGVLFSLIATGIADQKLTLDTPGGGINVFDIVLMLLRTLLASIPYVLLAFCLAVVARSTTLGVGGILVYVIVEGIVIAVLGGIGGTWADARVFFLGQNAAALLAANHIDTYSGGSLAFRDNPSASDLPDPWVAVFVIGIYCVILLAIAYYVFNKRDLGVESGAN